MDTISDDLPDWQECVWRRVSCQRQDCPICGDFDLWFEKKKEQNENFIITIEAGYKNRESWIESEYGKNLSWYATLLPTEVYRRLINRFEIENGIELSELDYQNTREIIKEILEIWFGSYDKTIHWRKIRNKLINIWVFYTAPTHDRYGALYN